MKIHYKIGFFIIIAIITWWLLGVLVKGKSKVNTMTLQQSPTEILQKKTSKIIKTSKTPIASLSEKVELEALHVTNDLRQLTYLELYEKSLDIENCSRYIRKIYQQRYPLNEGVSANKVIDFIEEYKQDIPRSSNNRQQYATSKQISAYQEHIENCKSVLAQVEALYDDEEAKTTNSYYLRTKIGLLLEITKAESEEEKQLKLTLEDVKSLGITFAKLYEISKGTTKISDEKIGKLISDIENLSWTVLRLKQDSANNQESQELIEKEAEFEEAKAHLASLYTYNKQAQAEKGDDLLSIVEKLNKKLNSKFPRVFNEAFKGLNFQGGGISELPENYTKQRFEKTNVNIPIISEQILEQVPIKNKDYFNQLLQPALDLYLCYLGQDCSFPINRKLSKFCFMGPLSYTDRQSWVVYEACEMNLEEFYLENYLTVNQVEDLSVIFDYLVKNYAK